MKRSVSGGETVTVLYESHPLGKPKTGGGTVIGDLLAFFDAHVST